MTCYEVLIKYLAINLSVSSKVNSETLSALTIGHSN